MPAVALGKAELLSKVKENLEVFANDKSWKKSSLMEEETDKTFIDALLGAFLTPFTSDKAIDVGKHQCKYRASDGSLCKVDYLWKDIIAIEMKTTGESHEKAFNQLRRYMLELPDQNEVPELWLVCDFKNFWLYRKGAETPDAFLVKFTLPNLPKHLSAFAPLYGEQLDECCREQEALNNRAVKKMSKLHDSLEKHGYTGHALALYLVRLLFCMFAQDTLIFFDKSFTKYVRESKPSDLHYRLMALFEILDTKPAERAGYTDELKSFEYINGGLFRDKIRLAPEFDKETYDTVLECCNFNWGGISPEIFGAMFQGVMDKAQRRELGAHYTKEDDKLPNRIRFSR